MTGLCTGHRGAIAPPPRDPGRPKLYRRNRTRILAVTFDHLVGGPGDRLTHTLVATLTGLSRQTIYNHFARIEDLQSAAVEFGLAPLAALIAPGPSTAWLPPITGLAQRLAAQLDATLYLAALRLRVTHPAAWLDEAFTRTVRRPQIEAVAATARAASAARRRASVDAPAIERFLIGLERRFLLPRLLPCPDGDPAPIDPALVEAEIRRLLGRSTDG